MSESHLLPKKELVELLEVSISGLRNWARDGAPLGTELSGDAVKVIQWYMDRPLFSCQWRTMRRREIYPALARQLQRDRWESN